MIRFLQTPGPIKKVVLGGLLVVICIAMLVYLIPSSGSSAFGGSNAHVVAMVEGSQISTDEVRQEAQQMLRQQFPRGGAQVGMMLPFFAQQAAEQLINRRMLVAEAERLGLHATEQEVRDDIQHGRYAARFFPKGEFVGQAQYEDMLAQANLSVAQFEDGVKQDLLLAKLQALVNGSASVSEKEIRQEFEKQNTKVKFDYAVIREEDLRKGIHPAEEELKAFYDRNKASYTNSIPEKRKVKYTVLDQGKVQSQVQVTNDELRAYYDQHRDEYRSPERVKVSHIMIKTPLPGPDGKVDEKGVEAAQKKAEDILKQLKAGAKFEDLAKKVSEDPGSAKEGGSLGWIRRGGFPVADVEKAAFALPKGGMSDVISAGYAFVILRVDDKEDAHIRTLDEVRSQIEPILRQQKAQRLVENEADTLLAQARAKGLDAAAAAKSLQVVTTDFFARTDVLPGVGASSQFMDAVFSEREKSPPDSAPIPQGYAVFELLAVKPPATPTFEEIRSRIEDEFKNQQASLQLTQKTQELSDRAKAEHDLKKAAKELGATVKTSDFVMPDGQVPDIGSMTGAASVAFSMKPGEISGPINNGNTGAIIWLLEKQPPSDQDFATKRDQIRDSLLQNKQRELFGLFVSNLRDQMEKSGKIRINQDELKTLTRTQNETGM